MSDREPGPVFDAVVLAGGRGSRLGGVSKPDVRVDGRRLLDIALGACAGARTVVAVGDVVAAPPVIVTREDPPFGGPVEGLAAGLAVIADPSPWTLLLASDLPGAEAAVRVLLGVVPGASDDGVALVDDEGRPQWLLGLYRTSALVERLGRRGDPPLTAMRRLLAPLRLLGADPGGACVADIDTPEQLAAWRARRLT